MVKYYAKEDFLWFKKGHYIPEDQMRDAWMQHCLVEDAPKVIEPEVVIKEEITGDLDGDGDFDKKDLTIAAKVMAKGKKKAKKKK